MARNANSRGPDPAAAACLAKSAAADHSATLSQVNPILKTHFDCAVGLLEQKADLAVDIAEWRRKARAEGLSPSVIVKLARAHLRSVEQERKAREAAEIESAYRAGLGLPLFDAAELRSRAAS